MSQQPAMPGATQVAVILRVAACLVAVLPTTAGLATPLPAQEVEPAARIRQAFYTPAQAARGLVVYRDQCAACHGDGLDGGAVSPLKGPAFARAWNKPDRTLDDLYYILRTTMPRDAGNSLPEGDYLATLAYMLERNGYPAGERLLTADPAVLSGVPLDDLGSAADGPARHVPEFIRGEGGLDPTGSGPTQEELLAADRNANDWLYHTHDYSGRRYVELSQINRQNAADLRAVCALQLGESSTLQTGPIVYRGVMYVTTVRTTVAMNATTCRRLWEHVWEPRDQEVWTNNRGVAIKDGRVVRGTSDGYLVALDAESGRFLWARQVADPSLGETITMPPLIYENLVLIGPAGSENNISGWVGAFRLENGEQVWRFQTVPDATEEGGDTWGNPQGIPLGGGAVWTPLALDVEREEVFVAVHQPGARPTRRSASGPKPLHELPRGPRRSNRRVALAGAARSERCARLGPHPSESVVRGAGRRNPAEPRRHGGKGRNPSRARSDDACSGCSKRRSPRKRTSMSL